MADGYVRTRHEASQAGLDIVMGTGQTLPPFRVFDVNENLLAGIGPGGSIISVAGGLAGHVVLNPATPYVMSGTDFFVILDATTGLVTITLPPIVAGTVASVFRISKSDGTANPVSIRASAGDTINVAAGGPSSYFLTSKGETALLISDGLHTWYNAFGSPANGAGVRTITTTPVTLILSDKTVLCNATAAGITLNLMAANAVPSGTHLYIKKTDVSANAVTITRAGADQIENGGALGTTFPLAAQFNFAHLISDGVSIWYAF